MYYIDMSVSLGFYADENLADKEEAEDLPKIVYFLQPWMAVAALVVFGMYLFFTLPDQTTLSSDKSEQIVKGTPAFTETEKDNNQLSKPVVAVLTKSVGLSWNSGSFKNPENGTGLHSGDFRLPKEWCS